MEEMNFDELHALADEKQYRSLKEKTDRDERGRHRLVYGGAGFGEKRW